MRPISDLQKSGSENKGGGRSVLNVLIPLTANLFSVVSKPQLVSPNKKLLKEIQLKIVVKKHEENYQMD